MWFLFVFLLLQLWVGGGWPVKTVVMYQIVLLLLSVCGFCMKAILSFFDFWTFFVVFFFYFSFHLCFDLPQVPNCYESDSFIF